MYPRVDCHGPRACLRSAFKVWNLRACLRRTIHENIWVSPLPGYWAPATMREKVPFPFVLLACHGGRTSPCCILQFIYFYIFLSSWLCFFNNVHIFFSCEPLIGPFRTLPFDTAIVHIMHLYAKNIRFHVFYMLQ